MKSWRDMLKGRDLGVEKYYSKENVEKLRKVYKTKVYPEIWKEKPSLDEWQVKVEAARRVLEYGALYSISAQKGLILMFTRPVILKTKTSIFGASACLIDWMQLK